MNAGAAPLRVLTLTNMWPTPKIPMGGIFVREQVDSLRRRGLEVDVLFVNGVEEGKTAYLGGFGKVRQAVQGGRYDLIHAHYVFSGMMALGQARPLTREKRIPVVLTQHGIETQRGWTAPLCRWTSRRVDRTIATSPRVQAALGLPGVQVVPCGVDTDLFRPSDQAEARAALGLPQAPRLALYVGMRRPEKRLDLVEAAVAEARQLAQRSGGPEIDLVIVDKEPHERIPLYLNACDVLVLASEGEGSPMVIKEAMACNLPIVSVDVGDVAQVIGGTAGCFIVEREVPALAAALCESLSAGRRTGGRNAIMPLSLAAIAARIEAIYRETLASR
jgi:glycosyltransferase involved in cell wall biosynthesis